MNNIIKAFEHNSDAADMLHTVYGISSDEHFDAVFIAPSWLAEKVFDADTLTPVYQDRFSVSHRITHGDKKYLYVRLQVGAPSVIDFCLSCYKLNCSQFVFIGSVGALVPEIGIGDVFIPTGAISGNGASLYLHDKLDAANLFEVTHSNTALNGRLGALCAAAGIATDDARVMSVDSVMCEYQHLDEFRTMGAKLIEMETATFFKSMELIGKAASAILVVSDNSAAGEHLMGRTPEQVAKYHGVRAKLKDILLQL